MNYQLHFYCSKCKNSCQVNSYDYLQGYLLSHIPNLFRWNRFVPRIRDFFVFKNKKVFCVLKTLRTGHKPVLVWRKNFIFYLNYLACSVYFLILIFAKSTYFFSFSIPTQFLPSALATIAVVPLPINGSKTKSPFLLAESKTC